MDTRLLAYSHAESVSEIAKWANSLIGKEVPDAPDYRVVKIVHFQFSQHGPGIYDALILVEVVANYPEEEELSLKEADIEAIEEITASIDERPIKIDERTA